MSNLINKLRLQFKDDSVLSDLLDKFEQHGSRFDADDIHYLLLMIEKLNNKN